MCMLVSELSLADSCCHCHDEVQYGAHYICASTVTPPLSAFGEACTGVASFRSVIRMCFCQDLLRSRCFRNFTPATPASGYKSATPQHVSYFPGSEVLHVSEFVPPTRTTCCVSDA